MLFSIETLDPNDDFSIELKKQESYDMEDNHFHDFYEIYYQLSGQRKYFIGERVYPIKKGEIVFINQYDLHRTIAAGPPEYSRILISFRKSFLEDFLPAIRDIDLYYGFKHHANIAEIPPASQAEIEILLFRMLSEYKKRQAGSLTALKSYLVMLLIFINRFTEPGCSVPEQDAAQQRLFEATHYITDHYADNLSLPETSRRFGFSPSYFCRVFKKATGFTFIEYVNAQRIREACRLLEQTRLPVTEIAGRVGFDSLTHFGRVFKSIMKIPPGSLRKAKLS